MLNRKAVFHRFLASLQTLQIVRVYRGWVIVGTLVFYLATRFIQPLLILPTLCAWLVPALTWQNLGNSARRQALVLFLLGGVALLVSARYGVVLSWEHIFSRNIPLLAMFVAVSFLSLTSTKEGEKDLPQGNRAALTTALGIHLLGAIINISALLVFADRIKQDGGLRKEQLLVLSRSFTAAAWWSPFFVATGVALTYAPGMHWQETLIPGLVMAVLALLYSVLEVCFFCSEKFIGYPLRRESLAVPFFLALLVLFLHYQWPGMSVLVLICLLAPLGALVFMQERPRSTTIHTFIQAKIDVVSSPFALFLAAGVFSAGIQSLLQINPSWFLLEAEQVGPALFALVLGLMIAVGIIGVHPVVSIAVVSPLLLPLHPDPSQLGFLFLSSWAISTCSSPLSGVGLVLVSRYQARPQMIIFANLLYAIVMWTSAVQVSFIFFN